MSKRIPKLLIIDMLQCLEKMIDYTNGMTYDSFVSDSKTIDAILRNIQVLGEAANRLPNTLKAKYPEIAWSKIIRSRHIVTHEYDGIDYEIIWKIVSEHAVSPRDSLAKILKEL